MRLILTLFPLVFFTSCATHYRIPTIGTSASLALEPAMFEIGTEFTGRHSGFTIFPLTLTPWCRSNAIDMAYDQAVSSAYDDGAADFLLEPRMKIENNNYILFQTVEVQLHGKSIRLKASN